jgi:TPR repeat protein
MLSSGALCRSLWNGASAPSPAAKPVNLEPTAPPALRALSGAGEARRSDSFTASETPIRSEAWGWWRLLAASSRARPAERTSPPSGAGSGLGAPQGLGRRTRLSSPVPQETAQTRKWSSQKSIFFLCIAAAFINGCGESGESPPVKQKSARLSPEQELAALLKRAGAGDVQALYDLGQMYGRGTGAPRDPVKAMEWYQKAAAQRHAEAQNSLGEMYAYGDDGVAKDVAKAAEWFQRAAAQGSASGQFNLGRIYYNGSGVPKDAAKAREWLEKAATQGYARAQLALGLLHQNGIGVAKDSAKALEWYQKAAAQGYAPGQSMLGAMYYWGEGAAKDTAKAAEWYHKAALQGEEDAQFALGEMYANGDGVPKDTAKAVEWYQEAAARGYAPAQVNLGLLLENGIGVAKDSAKALDWYQKAAAQGYAPGQFNLSLIYQNGIGVAKNAAKALEWLEKAAAQGYAPAQVNLGVLHQHGIGVAKDSAKAVQWYQKAAAQRHAQAQFNLSLMYQNGSGVAKDAVKALEWLAKAAAQGLASAQHGLGMRYEFGDGVPKDTAKAAEWIQKAAAQGYAPAQELLAVKYALGFGLPKDRVLAYAWSSLAAAGGEQGSARTRDSAEAELSASERVEAQRLSSNWKKGQSLVREGGTAGAAAIASPGPMSKKGTGTIFLVSSSGHAVTNRHVVGDCAELRIPGRDKLAKLLTEDAANDLALVQLQGAVTDTAAIAAEPGKLRQGDDIVAFGFPLNSVLSSGGNLTPGVVSALTGFGNNTNQIQITAPIQPGSSGSPVLNKKGEIVGVVSMKLDDMKMAKATGQVGQNVNFAVSGQTLKSFLDAHKVTYNTRSALFFWERSTADLADEARKWTLVVECWK